MSDNQEKIVIKDLDEALKYIEALDEFFTKYNKAYNKFKSMVRKLGFAEKKTFSYGFNPLSGKGMDKLIEQIVEKYLEERLGQSKPSEEEEYDEEADREAEELIQKLREMKKE
ncbi:MAG: hypothetical protein DRZ82_09850 [Thermoprotei archaeon]|nr:MAG: hypothetical protein DRZ82_09850 [Thermoprotei archaeon]